MILAGQALGRPALLLAAASTLHNLEEAFAYPSLRPRISEWIARHADLWWSPDPARFAAVLAALTLAIWALLGWTASGTPTAPKRAAVQVVAWVLLLNVALPHLPAAIALGGYAPGVVTAVAINLPVSIWVLRRNSA